MQVIRRILEPVEGAAHGLDEAPAARPVAARLPEEGAAEPSVVDVARLERRAADVVVRHQLALRPVVAVRRLGGLVEILERPWLREIFVIPLVETSARPSVKIPRFKVMVNKMY